MKTIIKLFAGLCLALSLSSCATWLTIADIATIDPTATQNKDKPRYFLGAQTKLTWILYVPVIITESAFICVMTKAGDIKCK